jgi:hypothetical protein
MTSTVTRYLVKPLALLIPVVLTGCLQGLHQRCEVNSDCNSGLVCSAASGTCISTTITADGLTPDAKPIDAAPFDSPKLDAAKLDASLVDGGM